MELLGTSGISPVAAGLAIRTADFDQHACAHRLVARRYGDRGYVNSLLSAHNDDALTICSAFHENTTVGTIAVRYESARGLNADTTFGPELAELRAGGLSLCEFSRLAVDREAGDNKKVLARLFHLAYLHAHRLAGCELLVIEVNPRHVAFYRRMLGFRVCGPERMNPRVNAPAVLLSLDMVWGREQIAHYGGRPDLAAQTRTLFPYFYDSAEEAAILATLRQ